MIDISWRYRPVFGASALLSAAVLMWLGLAADRNAGNYAVLIDFGVGIFMLVCLLIGALLVASAVWLTRTRGVRSWAVGITAAVWGALLCAVLPVELSMHDLGSATGRKTVAVSPDGEYELNAGEERFFTAYMILRLRSRDGLLSRESGMVACFGTDGVDSPDSRFARADFTGPTDVTIWSDAGESATVSFDPESLSLSPAFDIC